MPEHADGTFAGFALAVYNGDGVSKAAVSLQDRRGVDVNLLLFAAYVAARSTHVLTSNDISLARQRTARWQDEVVAPLRAVRRRLKQDSTAQALRATVHDAELAAEMLELDVLADLAEHFGPALPTEPSTAAVAATLELVLLSGADGAAPSDDDRRDIAVIAAAAGVR